MPEKNVYLVRPQFFIGKQILTITSLARVCSIALCKADSCLNNLTGLQPELKV